MDLNEVLKYTKKLNILYVEDEEISQELYASIFSDFFLSVEVASNGLEALEKYEKKPFDIVISDICMPKMDGINLCKIILKKIPNQHIIIMSAHNESDKLDEIKKLSIENILLKPIDNIDLMNMLMNISKEVIKLKQ